MKVCWVVHRYWPHPGGSEMIVTWCAEEMARRGIDTTVWVGNNFKYSFTERNGVQLQTGAVASEFDWLLIHSYNVAHQDMVISTRLPRSKAIFWPLIHYANKPMLTKAMNECAIIGCVKPSDTAAAKNDSRCRYLPWGIPDETFFCRSSRKPYLISAGGFWPNKGFVELIKWHAGLREQFDLVLAGYHDVPTAPIRNVTVLARPSYDELQQWISGAYAYVLNSGEEGFALVLLEAMRAGVPWLARPVGAAEQLAGGLLYTDQSSFRKQLRELERLPGLGIAGREAFVADFTIQRCVDRIIGVLNERI